MRQEILELVRLGPLPNEDADAEQIAQYERLLLSISPPVTDDEAKALVRLFGPDEAYGLAWTLLHLVESAPGWPIEDSLTHEDNEWISRLRRRAENARKQANKGQT